MRVQGGQQLARLSRQMKQAANKELQRSTRKRLRAAVQPILGEIRRDAAVNSQHVAASVVATFRYGGDTASAGIKAQRSRMPAGKENLPELMEFGSKGSGGRFIRHPVFGGEVRVNQPIRPFFFRNAREGTPKVQSAM